MIILYVQCSAINESGFTFHAMYVIEKYPLFEQSF